MQKSDELFVLKTKEELDVVANKSLIPELWGQREVISVEFKAKHSRF